MGKRVLIATGGTGGHVYPAIALAQQIKEQHPNCEIMFVGGGLSSNKFFDKETFNFQSIPCSSLTNFSVKGLILSLYQIMKGVWQSQKIIRKFNPDVAVGFGSYYAFPPLVAAKLLCVPIILHEANSIPGKVTRLLSPYAKITGVHFPETVHLLKGKALEVGMPLRQSFIKTRISKEEAKKSFGLQPDLTTILVFGGSQGAHSINMVVREAFKAAITKHQFQVLHITGDAALAVELKELYMEDKIPAVVKKFEDQMELAWQASDLVISRAGAGTIAEQLEFGVPGILIPYPKASENHQEHNADFMVAFVGGAVKINEKVLSSERLAESLDVLLNEDGSIREKLLESMNLYKKRARTRDLCSLVSECFEGK